jgi:hypothetical protein
MANTVKARDLTGSTRMSSYLYMTRPPPVLFILPPPWSLEVHRVRMDIEFAQRQARNTTRTISSNLTFQLLTIGLVLTQFSCILEFIIIIPLISAYLFLPLILMFLVFFAPNRVDNPNLAIDRAPRRQTLGFEWIPQSTVRIIWSGGRFLGSLDPSLENLEYDLRCVMLRCDTSKINLTKIVLIQAHQPY